jgi:hypothetical protein
MKTFGGVWFPHHLVPGGGKVSQSNSHLNDKLEDPSSVLAVVWRSKGECGDGVIIHMVVCGENEREGIWKERRR